MLNKDLETRQNIIKYCEDNNINKRDQFYLLHAFHVDTTEDLHNMIAYIKQHDDNIVVAESKEKTSGAKIYIFKPRDNQPKKD